MEKKQIEHLIERLSFRLFDTTLYVHVEEDHIYKHPVNGHGRPYLVVSYTAKCTDTGAQPISLMNDRNDHTGGDEFIVPGVHPYADL